MSGVRDQVLVLLPLEPNLAEIGRRLGVSRERVRQIKKRPEIREQARKYKMKQPGAEEIARRRAVLLASPTMADAAAELGIRRDRAYAWYNRYIGPRHVKANPGVMCWVAGFEAGVKAQQEQAQEG